MKKHLFKIVGWISFLCVFIVVVSDGMSERYFEFFLGVISLFLVDNFFNLDITGKVEEFKEYFIK